MVLSFETNEIYITIHKIWYAIDLKITGVMQHNLEGDSVLLQTLYHKGPRPSILILS